MKKVLVLVIGLPAVCSAAMAQAAYPVTPVTLVVPFPPGGAVSTR